MNFSTDIFTRFDKEWALVTAGSPENYNGMTISWGGMGTLWGKPVVTVYVKPVRYTYGFMNENDYFTVSFYPESCKKALGVMGSESGRDGDKAAKAGLTPIAVGEEGRATTFAEAEVTLLCKKIYWNDLDKANMPEYAVERYYTEEEPHRMFIGEVVDIIRK